MSVFKNQYNSRIENQLFYGLFLRLELLCIYTPMYYLSVHVTICLELYVVIRASNVVNKVAVCVCVIIIIITDISDHGISERC